MVGTRRRPTEGHGDEGVYHARGTSTVVVGDTRAGRGKRLSSSGDESLAKRRKQAIERIDDTIINGHLSSQTKSETARQPARTALEGVDIAPGIAGTRRGKDHNDASSEEEVVEDEMQPIGQEAYTHLPERSPELVLPKANSIGSELNGGIIVGQEQAYTPHISEVKHGPGTTAAMRQEVEGAAVTSYPTWSTESLQNEPGDTETFAEKAGTGLIQSSSNLTTDAANNQLPLVVAGDSVASPILADDIAAKANQAALLAMEAALADTPVTHHHASQAPPIGSHIPTRLGIQPYMQSPYGRSSSQPQAIPYTSPFAHAPQTPIPRFQPQHFESSRTPMPQMSDQFMQGMPGQGNPGGQSHPTHALYEMARQATSGKSTTPISRRQATPSQRRPWTSDEEQALMQGLDAVKGPHWSMILQLYGPGGKVNEVLKDRNQVQLKDKARNLKLWFLKSGVEVPVNLKAVTGELKTRAPAAVRSSTGNARTSPPTSQPQKGTAIAGYEPANNGDTPTSQPHSQAQTPTASHAEMHATNSFHDRAGAAINTHRRPAAAENFDSQEDDSYHYANDAALAAAQAIADLQAMRGALSSGMIGETPSLERVNETGDARPESAVELDIKMEHVEVSAIPTLSAASTS